MEEVLAATTNSSISHRRWMVPLTFCILALFTFSHELEFIYWEVPGVREMVTKRQNNQTPHIIRTILQSMDKPAFALHFDDGVVGTYDTVTNINLTIPVFILPILPGTECPNDIYEEGTRISSVIRIVSNINASTQANSQFVWLHQAMSNRWGPVCHPEWLDQAREFYIQERPSLVSSNATSQNQTLWDGAGDIHVLDWFDRPDYLPRCQNMEDLAGIHHVHYWKRSIVEGRRWNNLTRTLELGHVKSEVNGAPVNFLAYPVRSDVVDAIHKHVQQSAIDYERIVSDDSKSKPSGQSNTPKTKAAALTEYLATKERPGDVVHYWPVNGSNGGISRGSKNHDNSVFRTVTSQALLELRNPPYNVPTIVCDVQGQAGRRGRATVTNDYVVSMLHYKIIVVVQRDEWEGHFRMFEAMVSGAMVIHDRMLALPLGIKDNENIVMFDTMEELKNKVMYYLKNHKERLEIARRGRQLAMCHHRSWHRMEQVIFGRTVTSCDE